MKKFKFKINGSEYEVSVNELEKNIAEIEVNGTPFVVEIEQDKLSMTSIRSKIAGKVEPISTPNRQVSASIIKAPLPGNIMKILVTTGQSVKRGDVLLTMESMKMENNILAENDGIVKNIYVQAAQSVLQDEVMMDLEGVEVISASKPQPTISTSKNKMPIAPISISSGKLTVLSPLPGNILNIAVVVGQTVKRGALLVTLESMKMENNVLSERDGVVKAIHITQGQSVMQDDPLVDID